MKQSQYNRQPEGMPADLREADELLERYGKWAQDRYHKRRCGSAEGAYKSPQICDEEGAPEPLMADFRAMDVHRAILGVPLAYRRVIFAHHIPQRLPPQAQRRKLGLSSKIWEQTLVAGTRMFWNIFTKKC